jgi:hypothetical protein
MRRLEQATYRPPGADKFVGLLLAKREAGALKERRIPYHDES